MVKCGTAARPQPRETIVDLWVSALLVVLVSVLIGLLSSVATMKLVDTKKLRSDMEEVKEWQRKFKIARNTRDPVALQEVIDSQSRMMQIQTSMMGAQCKPQLIFIIPLLLIYGVLSSLFGATPVAILPFNPQEFLPFLEGSIGMSVPGSGFGLYFWSWYMMTAFSLGALIRKAFNLGYP